MFGDNRFIGLGGSRKKGRFALSLQDGFYRGSTMPTETYANEQLASQTDFKVRFFEIWALTD